jgi:hypothetical protein
MPVGCNALNSIQMIAGCDMHKQIPPPPPVGPLPFAPHVVIAITGMAPASTSKASTTVKAGWGYALGRQHDLGMGPYHFAANLLLPLVWAGAGNKAQFGVASVSIESQGSKGVKLAVALIPGAGLNLQLDCNEPCALPTSMCIASLNTVTAGFSLGDCLGGFAAMISDIAITWLTGQIAEALTGVAEGVLGGILELIGPEALLVAGLAAAALPTLAYTLKETTKMMIGWVIGSPLGYSYTGKILGVQVGWGSTYGGALNDTINDHVSHYISPPPTVPAAPTSGPSGPSTPSGPATPPAEQ